MQLNYEYRHRAVRRPCSDFMDMLRRLINYRIIIIIIIIISVRNNSVTDLQCRSIFVRLAVVAAQNAYRLISFRDVQPM